MLNLLTKRFWVFQSAEIFNHAFLPGFIQSRPFLNHAFNNFLPAVFVFFSDFGTYTVDIVAFYTVSLDKRRVIFLFFGFILGKCRRKAKPRNEFLL